MHFNFLSATFFISFFDSHFSSFTSGNEVEDPYLIIRMMPELELVEDRFGNDEEKIFKMPFHSLLSYPQAHATESLTLLLF